MMRRIPRIAVLMAVLTAMVGVQTAQAEVPITNDSDATSSTVRVLNNYRSAVRVFLEDAEGNIHLLGRVARRGLQTFEIPENLVQEGGYVEIKAYPVGLLSGVLISDGPNPGVKTSTIALVPGRIIDFWLEHDLASSTVSIG
ncbi:MAG: hypothetical protein BMS9Abin29_0891 [Gemmatimonadota bacterium]|nr:MAG: hypothetical protein BMS9Abin29_0891 [Gemmatimonadota bacterium]